VGILEISSRWTARVPGRKNLRKRKPEKMRSGTRAKKKQKQGKKNPRISTGLKIGHHKGKGAQIRVSRLEIARTATADKLDGEHWGACYDLTKTRVPAV
jgi:hypothetical protein